jgi:hypothetical protein
MVLLVQGDHIWIEPTVKSEFSCPIGARVLDTDQGRIRVLDDESNVSVRAHKHAHARVYRNNGWDQTDGSKSCTRRPSKASKT